MKKKDLTGMTKSYEILYSTQKNNAFNRKDLFDKLNACGVNTNIVNALLKFGKIFRGTDGLYRFKEPVSKDDFEAIYEMRREQAKESYKNKSNPISINEALQVLNASGEFLIKRISGFDMDRFKKDHPSLYKEYAIYK